MNTLPDELLGLIVSQLAESQDDIRMDDFPSLRCLASVSRKFHRLVRPSLYRTIVLNTTEDAPKLLLRTVDENQDLAACVRTINAVYTGSPASCEKHLNPTINNNNKLAVLMYLFGRFENLSTFSCSYPWGSQFLAASHKFFTEREPFWHRPKVVRVAVGADLFCLLPYLLGRPTLERLILIDIELYDRFVTPPPRRLSGGSNIKHLTLRLLRFESLSQVRPLAYLADIVPNLESLRIELANVHHETCICALAMLMIFKEQISNKLCKLEIIHNADAEVDHCLLRCQDGRDTTQLILSEQSLREGLRMSKLTHLSIDIDSIINRPQVLLEPWVIRNIELPETLQRLDLRYADPTEGYSNAPTIPQLGETVEEIRRRFTVLERINLELCTAWDHKLLLGPLEAEFAKVGIVFRVKKVSKLPVRSWEAFPNFMPNHEEIRFRIFTGCGPQFSPLTTG